MVFFGNQAGESRVMDPEFKPNPSPDAHLASISISDCGFRIADWSSATFSGSRSLDNGHFKDNFGWRIWECGLKRHWGDGHFHFGFGIAEFGLKKRPRSGRLGT